MEENGLNLQPASLQIAIGSWDYDEAVARSIPKVVRWSEATVELYRELYIAREALSRKGGDRLREGQYLKTWSDFCTDIGYTRQAVNMRLKNFIPAELSPSGKDTLLAEQKKSKEDIEAARARRIAQFRETGVRPDDWTDDDDAYLRRLTDEDKAAQIARDAVVSIIQYRKVYKPSRDYFTEILSRDRIREVNKFKLTDKKLRVAQQSAGDAISKFLFSIPDLDDRAKAAANLVARLRDVINDSLEAAIRHDGPDSADDAEYEIADEK